jgi:hypothetical protein
MSAPEDAAGPAPRGASPLAPLRPTRAILAAAAALALLFAGAVALGLHGFSIPTWRQGIDGSAPSEILLGRPQGIRVDDYAVVLPLALAQIAHQPPFPVVNRNVGAGSPMLLPFQIPVAHPATLFRPDTWGFFLGPDAGLAWRWWTRWLGLFAVWGLVLLVVTGGDRAASALGALALVMAPFFQFWGLRTVPAALHGGVAVLGALGVLFARRPAPIVLSGLALGMAGGGFGLVFYPPFQVPVAYLGVALVAAVAFVHREALAPRERLGWRLAAAGLASALVALAAGSLLWSAGDAIDRMLHTSYPGHRISVGGDRSLAELLGANLGVPVAVEDFGPLLNVCESAGFWLLSLPLAAAALWRGARAGRRLDALEIALLAVVVGLALHALVPMPRWLARATGFASVPGRRSAIALGLADVLLAARLLARRGAPWGHGAAAALAGAWAALLALAAVRLSGALPAYPAALGLGFAAANAALVWLALRAARPWLPMAALAAASCGVAGWFNPLVRGGSEYLRENELSRAILAVDRAHGGDTVWVSYGDWVIPNLFRVLGVRALNGVVPVPQFELWAPLDPEGRARSIYNRFAHVVFEPTPGREPRFEQLAYDAFAVHVDPGSDALRALGVTHFLIESPDPAALAARSGATWVASVGRRQLFRTRWTPAPAGGGP